MKANVVHGALFGVAIGDALGVPAEFNSRERLKLDPIKDFVGYKSHNQPPGTFSDDSSLTFCLAESLCNGYDLNDAGKRFVLWWDEGYWTAGGEVFDIGMTTNRAINRLKRGTRPALAGDFDEGANGNGSLMRIMPLLFYIRNFELEERYAIIKDVSSVTHGHIRSVIACFYYLEFALDLLNGEHRLHAYLKTTNRVNDFIRNRDFPKEEVALFDPLLRKFITELSPVISIHHAHLTIQAGMYCFMKTDSYEEAVLMAVNLGDDTDTTASVTGGLAGIYYGFDAIPVKWRNEIRRSNDINDLCNRLAAAMEIK